MRQSDLNFGCWSRHRGRLLDRAFGYHQPGTSWTAVRIRRTCSV